jgi:hypothetical protein
MVASAGFKVEVLGEEFVDESFPDFYEADLATFDNFWPDGGGGGGTVTRDAILGNWHLVSMTSDGTKYTCPAKWGPSAAEGCSANDSISLYTSPYPDNGTMTWNTGGVARTSEPWSLSGSTINFVDMLDGHVTTFDVWLSADGLNMHWTLSKDGHTAVLEFRRQ